MSRRTQETSKSQKRHGICVSTMEQSCQGVARMLRALSHPDRLMIMGHLTQGPLTVSGLMKCCRISQSQLSQYLGRMQAEGLVLSRRHGRFKFYEIADERMIELIVELQRLFCQQKRRVS